MTSKTTQGAAVTADDLMRYTARKVEIRCLKQQLESGELLITDSVRGSCPDFPYTEHNITIQGYDQRRAAKAENKIAELIAKCEAVDLWLERLSSENDRVLFMRRFIQEWSLIKLGMEYGISDEGARKKIERALKKYF
ncbi:MAG: hypothetical protein PHI27_06600 [Eubacteriales bacterium]|nr:hypothetical protein [Eubacteriales bacterium]MDD4513743.1 hypothetical protein [Eubacteriales bacterium]